MNIKEIGEIISKTNTVIFSCKTMEQVTVAFNYVDRATKVLNKSMNFSHKISFNNLTMGNLDFVIGQIRTSQAHKEKLIAEYGEDLYEQAFGEK